MLARGNENFRAPGEHGFSFFQVKMFTGSVSVLLTSTSLKIKKLKLAETTQETEHRNSLGATKIFEPRASMVSPSSK